VANCRSCGAPLTWAITENDKKIPVDSDPSPDGNITLTREDGLDDRGKPILRARVFPHSGATPEGAVLFKSHFATCPDASGHRR
jgi:hypothetical protein